MYSSKTICELTSNPFFKMNTTISYFQESKLQTQIDLHLQNVNKRNA